MDLWQSFDLCLLSARIRDVCRMPSCVQFLWGSAIHCHLHSEEEEMGTHKVSKTAKLIYEGRKEAGFLFKHPFCRGVPFTPLVDEEEYIRTEVRKVMASRLMTITITLLPATSGRPLLSIFAVLIISVGANSA